MAYFRTLKTGDKTLIYTAKDRAVQATRYTMKSNALSFEMARSVRWDRESVREGVSLYIAVHGFGGALEAIDEVIIDAEQDLARLYIRLHATMKMAYRKVYSRNASLSGSPLYVRVQIEEQRARLAYYRRLRAALFA